MVHVLKEKVYFFIKQCLCAYINTEQLLYMQISKLQFNKKNACLVFVFSVFCYSPHESTKNHIYVLVHCL